MIPRLSSRQRVAWVAALLVGLLFGLLLGRPAQAAETALDASLNERVIMVPSADGPAVALQVTVFTLAGTGPFPLAVLNHGKRAGLPSAQPRDRAPYLARYFLSRGYAVALPMMRGFAASQGDLGYRLCGAEAVGLNAARDIRAVIDAMAREPGVDVRRVVVSGQSFGGWNTLAFGTLRDDRVKALVNFNGGLEDPHCATWQARLLDAAGGYGARSRTPSLWFYGDNDSRFQLALWRAMFDRYRARGAPAELVDVGRFLDDSHQILGQPEGLAIWVPRLDAFLTAIGLPGAERGAGILPAPYPAASHFAAIDDLRAVPHLRGEAAEQAYRAFLKMPLPRVFVIGPKAMTSFHGGLDPLARAMQACADASPSCRPYAIDNDVVWAPEPAGSAPR
ncbi:MAG TPA: prolyl oligopeptidase family serine peptidase [Burkholderiaceae bacterium]